MAHQEDMEINSDPLKKYASGYEDFLQSPLQPLMDNLESGTYEVFEKDPVKYRDELTLCQFHEINFSQLKLSYHTNFLILSD